MIDFRHARAEDFLPTVDDDSVDLVLVDPPYFREIDQKWDRQWPDEQSYLEWLAGMCAEWSRVLRHNGSLYCFASPSMSWKVAAVIGRRFNVLNVIRWEKPTAQQKKASPEQQRRYINSWEACVFAELPGADSTARGESGYGAALDEARGMVFEPLRAYFVAERDRRGLSTKSVVDGCELLNASHFFTASQWRMPNKEAWKKLRQLFGPGYLPRPYDELKAEYDELKAEYDELKAEYEHRRRPFSVEHGARNRPDLWTYDVPTGDDRHPCEKPLDMLRDIIRTSTRPGAVVLDCFGGRASTACACVDTKRNFIGSEMGDHWHARGVERIEDHKLTPRPAQMREISGPLFGGP
jgi:site-specific DNA-methyltransferase (adenine-specific)